MQKYEKLEKIGEGMIIIFENCCFIDKYKFMSFIEYYFIVFCIVCGKKICLWFFLLFWMFLGIYGIVFKVKYKEIYEIVVLK